MMTSHPNLPARLLLLAACTFIILPLYGPLSRVQAQTTPPQQSQPAPPPPTDARPAPPAPPQAPKVKNPNNQPHSLRFDVPIVNTDANVILDKTHQFVPG